MFTKHLQTFTEVQSVCYAPGCSFIHFPTLTSCRKGTVGLTVDALKSVAFIPHRKKTQSMTSAQFKPSLCSVVSTHTETTTEMIEPGGRILSSVLMFVHFSTC